MTERIRITNKMLFNWLKMWFGQVAWDILYKPEFAILDPNHAHNATVLPVQGWACSDQCT